ncbi:GNAT family N-acetyltransferase [Bacillus inaquosorum]|uniref:YxbD n=1 Tax=Bacillus inaquosorum KCTC 13429 TaxID=1236548 RepID=A0A9W5LGL1_9BACI|nr:GNAT family N-acetyltransferase [Bacillus inaquosorum]AWM15942.1 GNAT family N-acetyltransferase [Bacillus inaquosorum]ELS60369.1 YxbD [Bacillus inaquosorum KCTC 13429]
MIIIPNNELPKQMMADFFAKHWGTPKMVISSGIFRCNELDGYAAVDESGEIIGCITYVIDRKDCEIISLDSIIEKKGFGTALLQQVEETAKHAHCHRIKLITTNDNVHAMAFYQKRGYQFAALFPNAVEKARQIKPEIPVKAENGILIRDEILFSKIIAENE